MADKKHESLVSEAGDPSKIADVCNRYTRSISTQDTRKGPTKVDSSSHSDSGSFVPNARNFSNTYQRAAYLRAYLERKDIKPWIEEDLDQLRKVATLPPIPVEALSILQHDEAKEQFREEDVEYLQQKLLDLQKSNSALLQEKDKLENTIANLSRKLGQDEGRTPRPAGS